MIVLPKQAKRFYRLFDMLIVYANSRLQVSQRLITPYGDVDDYERFDVVRALWEGGDNRHIVADFVRENPRGLSPSDLREVARWEHAFFGSFAIARSGRDVFFLYADHAIAVRGLTREVDAALSHVPTLAETALLPFENAVVYALSISEFNVQMGPGILRSIQNDLEDALRGRRDIRSASRFVQMAPQLEEACLRAEAEDFAYQTELDMNADAQVAGQHRGALAGLDREARARAVQAHLAETDNSLGTDLLVKELSSLCFRGEPARTLHDAFHKFNKYELQQIARTAGVPGAVSSMSKRQLVESIEAHMQVDREGLLALIRMAPAQTVRDLRLLVRCGGTVLVADEQVGSTKDVVGTYFPLALAYHRAHTFATVMPDEVLEMLSDVDWDAEVAHAELFEGALKYLASMVDLRGAVFFDQALDECSERTGIDLAEDGEDLMAMLVAGVKAGVSPISVLRYGEDLLLADPAMEDSLYDYSDSAREWDRMLDMFFQQCEGKPVRQVPDELLVAGSVVDWLLASEEASALMAYLDEHVPDGKDDYFFAEDIAAEVIGGARVVDNPAELLLGTFEMYDYQPTEAQLKRVLDLATSLMNKVPKWTNNGWAPVDLAARR